MSHSFEQTLHQGRCLEGRAPVSRRSASLVMRTPTGTTADATACLLEWPAGQRPAAPKVGTHVEVLGLSHAAGGV